jgi:hypothetical protein
MRRSALLTGCLSDTEQRHDRREGNARPWHLQSYVREMLQNESAKQGSRQSFRTDHRFHNTKGKRQYRATGLCSERCTVLYKQPVILSGLPVASSVKLVIWLPR